MSFPTNETKIQDLEHVFNEFSMPNAREHATHFVEQDIDVGMLLDLTKEDIDSLLPTLGARRKLKSYINAMRDMDRDYTQRGSGSTKVRCTCARSDGLENYRL